jgi:hypothetical protein
MVACIDALRRRQWRVLLRNLGRHSLQASERRTALQTADETAAALRDDQPGDSRQSSEAICR